MLPPENIPPDIPDTLSVPPVDTYNSDNRDESDLATQPISAQNQDTTSDDTNVVLAPVCDTTPHRELSKRSRKIPQYLKDYEVYGLSTNGN